jgi:hypothetical protein
MNLTPPHPGANAPALTEKIREDVTRSLRKRLGLADGEVILAQLLPMIDEAAASAADNTVKLGLQADAEAAAKDIARPVMFDGFLDKMSAARQGIELIGGSDDVKAILRRRAELLWAKKQSLEAAGFDTAAAMQIILAELGARTR